MVPQFPVKILGRGRGEANTSNQIWETVCANTIRKKRTKKLILICEDSDKMQRSHGLRNAGGKYWKGRQSSRSRDSPSLWHTSLAKVSTCKYYIPVKIKKGIDNLKYESKYVFDILIICNQGNWTVEYFLLNLEKVQVASNQSCLNTKLLVPLNHILTRATSHHGILAHEKL